jgi:ribosomal RNA assembly protein
LIFEQRVKVPMERVGAVVGKGGQVKSYIEERCGVELEIDGKTGEVTVRATDVENADPFKAVNIVTAIGRGFSPERAYRLLDDEVTLDIIDLRGYVGKSPDALRRVRGRIIGMDGKARRTIEELTGAYLSVYGHTVALIGTIDEVRLAREAVDLLGRGSQHRTVYRVLERARSKAKEARLKLWEDTSLG